MSNVFYSTATCTYFFIPFFFFVVFFLRREEKKRQGLLLALNVCFFQASGLSELYSFENILYTVYVFYIILTSILHCDVEP